MTEELRRTSDSGTAILSAVAIEQGLEVLIESSLENRKEEDLAPLYERDGALSTMFAKIHLAYAMHLIDAPLRDDIEVVRRVRNAFAHARKPITFLTPEVARECKKLKTISSKDHPIYRLYHRHTGTPLEEAPVRGIFTLASLCIDRHLTALALAREKQELRVLLRRAKRAERRASKLRGEPEMPL